MARISRYLVWICLPLSLFLGGCMFQKSTPDEVISKLARASSELITFQYSVDLSLAGRLPIAIVKDVNSASVQLFGSADSKDPNNPQFTLQANLSGNSSTGQFAINGDLVGTEGYTYFRMTNLSLPTLSPVSLGADSRWYKIRHLDSSNPNEKKLGVLEKKTFTPQELEELRLFLSSTPIFEITEVLPDATVNGQRSYHYRTKITQESIADLSEKIGKLLGVSINQKNTDSLLAYEPELWINKRTFQLSQLKLVGLYQTDGLPIDFDFTLGLSRHNEKLTITAPKASEELDPRQWITQLPL